MSEIKSGYTRVSDILSRLKDRTKINQIVLHEKCNVGTEVHSNIHAELIGCPLIFEDFPIRNPMSGKILFDKQGKERWEKRGLGYFKSWCEWQKEANPRYITMEDRYYDDELMLTGQIDAVIELEATICLLDYKCSYSPDLVVWPMQAHFYWYLLTQNKVQIGDRFLFVQLKKDGKLPIVHEFKFDQNILLQCIQEAVKYNEEKSIAKGID